MKTFKEYVNVNERITNKGRMLNIDHYLDEAEKFVNMAYGSISDLMRPERDVYGASYGKHDPKSQKGLFKHEKALNVALANLRKYAKSVKPVE